MKQHNDEKLRELLRRAMPPLGAPELERDLWPQMLRKLDERPTQVAWLDWALVAVVAIWLFFSPETILVLLYHL